MKSRDTIIFFAGLWAAAAGFGGCKPKTTMEKLQDKAEDVGHEMGQGMDHMKDSAQDAGHEIHQGMERAVDKAEKAAK